MGDMGTLSKFGPLRPPPRPDTPPVVAAFNDPTWGLLLVYADGRIARKLPASGRWVAMDGPDFAALWPAPAPVAPVAD